MDTNLPGSGEPEYLGDGPEDPSTQGPSTQGDGPDGPEGDAAAPRTRRRTAILAASGLAVVAVVGVGGWGLAQFLSGGDQPAAAFPADTAAYLSLDLDPSAGQKIEAIKTLKKFPGLAKHMDLGARDDLRRYVFEKMTESGKCKGVDYGKDIEPWIGDRLGVAAVPDGGKPVAVVALQASDENAARAAAKKLDACDGSGKPTGVAYSNGYLLLSDTQEHADFVAADAAKGTLADDASYQTWMQRAGDPGVITGYAAKGAPEMMKNLLASDPSMLGAPMPGMAGSMGPEQMMNKAFSGYKNFEGAAMVVRFGSGSFETEMVTKGVDQTRFTVGKAPSVADLPASTAVAMSTGVRKGWLRNYLKTMGQMMGGGANVDQMLRQGEAQTGLKLPEDIETLLGQGVTVAVDGNIDMAGLQQSPDPTKVPVAIRINGDPAKITPIIDKLKRAAGPQAGIVQVKTEDGIVLVGLDPAYLDEVTKQGGLGSTSAFQEAVPHADGAAGIFYISFDAGDWAAKLGDLLSGGNADVRANIEPLQAFGMSSWVDGDKVAHVELKLTTD
ncbi:MAG: DUF3352 domain-containing protein [Nocardioidaceae bacterium]